MAKEGYLAWFKWRLSFNRDRTPQEAAELVVRQAARGTYEAKWRDYKDTPYPFWDYWEGQSCTREAALFALLARARARARADGA